MISKRDTLGPTTLKLAELMKEDPEGIEEELFDQGENLVGLFEDPNFTTRRFPDLKLQKIEVIKRVIEDIAAGVMILRSSTIGLSFRENAISSFISPLGTLPMGTVVYSLNWKNVAAFKAWRHGEGDDIRQDDINAAIYFLTVHISRLI